MNVDAILRRKGTDVVSVRPDESLRHAAQLLNTRGIGAAVVRDDGERLLGILSERDVVRAVAAEGAGCLDHLVSRWMTRDLVTCQPQDDLTQIMGKMTDRRIRHLPVLRDGALAGIISIGDVVKYRLAEIEREAQDLREFITH